MEEEPTESTRLLDDSNTSNDDKNADSKYPNDPLIKWELNAWNEQKKWSKVAGRLRGEEIKWRNRKLRLSVGAVFLQTLASQIQQGVLELGPISLFFPFPGISRRILSLLAGACLVYVQHANENLSPEKIADRTDSRLVGEELLSEIWMSLAGAEPYAQRDQAAARVFNERIRAIVQSEAGAEKERFGIHPICVLTVKETEEPLPLRERDRMPKCGKTTFKDGGYEVFKTRKDMYMQKRVGHDLRRRKEKAKGAEERAAKWRKVETVFTLGSAAIGVILNNVDNANGLAVWATVFTTAAAAVAAHIQACRFEENRTSLYGVAMSLEECKEEREENESNETQEQWNRFVKSFERLLLSQTRKWRRNTIQAAGDNNQPGQGIPVIKDEEAQVDVTSRTASTSAEDGTSSISERK